MAARGNDERATNRKLIPEPSNCTGAPELDLRTIGRWVLAEAARRALQAGARRNESGVAPDASRSSMNSPPRHDEQPRNGNGGAA